MGSWYNMKFSNSNGNTRLNPCETTCGEKPTLVVGSRTSPQTILDFQTKSVNWDECMKTCAKTNAQNTIETISTLDSPNTRPLEITDEQPLGIGVATPKGISKNMILLGVGALAVIGFLMLRRK